MRSKTCVVTGANSGIGFATAKELANRGARVILVCRSSERGRRAVSEIARDAKSKSVHLLLADLASLTATRKLADDLSTQFDAIDVLINNAGTTTMERRESADGFELQLAVNYLAPFLLTNLLRPMLQQSNGARIVNLAGIYHKRSKLDLRDLNWKVRPYNGMQASCDSQLARVLFTRELARRWPAHITANCVHPGAVLTNAQKAAPWWAKLLIHTVARPAFVKPDKGALPVIRLACDDDIANVTGSFFNKLKLDASTPESNDAERAATLWEQSAALTGIASGA